MPSSQYPLILEQDTLLPIRPRTYQRQHLTPSQRWEPGSALIPLLVATPALLIAAIRAAQSAPKALRLLAGLNVPAALSELDQALFAAGLGIIGATLAMVFLAGRQTRRPGSGRAWASRHLERKVQARQGWISRPTDSVVVVQRQGYARATMPAITPLPDWDASDIRSILATHARMAVTSLPQQRHMRPTSRKTAKLTRKLAAAHERQYMPLLPMPA